MQKVTREDIEKRYREIAKSGPKKRYRLSKNEVINLVEEFLYAKSPTYTYNHMSWMAAQGYGPNGNKL